VDCRYSERSGWRHLYHAIPDDESGGVTMRDITAGLGDADVISVLRVDEAGTPAPVPPWMRSVLICDGARTHTWGGT
jgi:hypothetical protein